MEAAGIQQSSELLVEEHWTKVANQIDKNRNRSSKRGSRTQLPNETGTPENPEDPKGEKASLLNDDLTTHGKGGMKPANPEKIENLNFFSLLQNAECSAVSEDTSFPVQNLLGNGYPKSSPCTFAVLW